jgi:pimeloyl-ACP methyl ester carboxylesterase
VERFSLVVHDWGAVGLSLAQRRPERIERLVVIDAVPLTAAYRWHGIARIWRRPLLGELFMGAATRFAFKRLSRKATATGEPLPDELIDDVWRHFDHGTQRAILRLYRSADPAVLEAAGAQLERIAAPALVVWGRQDPYLPMRFAEEYAARLPGARLRVVDDAGHWPWVERPELIDEIGSFLDG